MRKLLPVTIIAFLVMIVFCLGSTAGYAQSAGFNTTYLVLQVNNGGNTYYDLQATTINPDFSGANLGTFCQNASNALIFKGAEHNVYKCGGCDLQSTRVYYRIYPTGNATGNFVSNNIGYTSGFGNGCGGEDQQWSNTGYNTNLLSGLAAGTYSLEVYSDATTTCSGGTVYAGNNGANYIATFTVAANVTYYADNDADGFGNPDVSITSCTGAPTGYVTNSLDCNDNIWYYVDDDGDGFGSTTFSPCQGVLNNTDCDDTLLMYVDADGDGFGSETFADCGPTNNDDCDDNMLMYVDNDSDGFGTTVFKACNGATNNLDCNDALVTYEDLDEDGWGSETFAPCGVLNNDDCDDNQLTYIDDDGDGFGSTTAAPCGADNNSDCDDTLLLYEDNDGDGWGSTVFAPCGINDNDDCDDNLLTYVDSDGDGFGSMTPAACGPSNNTDCDDTNPNLRGLFMFYTDADGDGYGAGTDMTEVCALNATTAPAGYSTTQDDCDDANSAISPGASEVYYNGIDDNCEGTLDEGAQLLSQVIETQCGSTLPTLTSIIYAQNFNNSTSYRFEVTNTATNEVQILERPIRWFRLNMLDEFEYSTTYSIRVQIQRNGIWLGYYGPACLVSTPDVVAPTTGIAQLVSNQCGGTLPSVNTIVSSNSINGATGYRFRITNMTDEEAPNQVQIIDRPLRWFNLTMLSNYNYGTTYMVEVAVKTTGDYTDYGTACMITTPNAPTLIQCGQSIGKDDAIISATSLNNVTMYKFEFTNLATNEVMVIDRPVRWFTFMMLPTYAPATQYGVRIAVMTAGHYSPYGASCTITSPGATRPGGVKEISEPFAAVAYPNPFAETFSLAVSNSEKVNVKVYDMTGRLVESVEMNSENLQQQMLGSSYPSGVYNVIVSSSQDVKTLRVIKR